MDIDIFSQDTGFEERFNKYNGPANESTYQFLKRCYQGISKRVYDPERKLYDIIDLNPKLSFENSLKDNTTFDVTEFDILLQPLIKENLPQKYVHIALWKCVNSLEMAPSILYLHTNGRNLVDALEVIPLCLSTGANLIAVDLPGHGKTEETLLTPQMGINVIKSVICWLIDNQLCFGGVTLWARGMSTAAAIQYCTFENKELIHQNQQEIIKLLVLDTPYTGLHDVVNDAVEKLRKQGYFVPSPLVAFFSKIIRNSLTPKIGIDPYKIKPIEDAPKIRIKTIILAAMNDDYISIDHSNRIAHEMNKSTARGQYNEGADICTVYQFEGSHFSYRTENIIQIVSQHLEILKEVPGNTQCNSMAAESNPSAESTLCLVPPTSTPSPLSSSRKKTSLNPFMASRARERSRTISLDMDKPEELPAQPPQPPQRAAKPLLAFIMGKKR